MDKRRVSARVRRNRTIAVLILVAIALIVAGIIGLVQRDDDSEPADSATSSAAPGGPEASTPPSTAPSESSTPSAPPSEPAAPVETSEPADDGFDKTLHSTDDPSSIWVVSNKARPLDPIDYAPSDLVYPDLPNVNGQPVRAVMVDALEQLFDSAHDAGFDLAIQSAYRSYGTQKSIYDRLVAANGRAAADSDTARPGHSEHQTGLTVDLATIPADCTLQQCFGDTAAGQWLAKNAWKYGFLLRYPADKEQITGYIYEPWHFRYIGTKLAEEMHREGVTTLEEFFDLPGGTEYSDD